MVIITRTDCPDYEKYVNVVKRYHESGNIGARYSDRYEFNEYDLEKVLLLAERLWYHGKIHQPRSFTGGGGVLGYQHPFRMNDRLWWQVVPTIDNSTPAVVDAYEKYKMLDILTR